MNKSVILLPIIFGVFILANQCAPSPDHDEHDDHGGHHGFMDMLKEYHDTINYDLVTTDILDSTYLLKVHAQLPEVEDFFVETRTQNIMSFPCANCHNKPLADMQKDRLTEVRKAHWNIQLIHASSETMNCTTCHSKGDMNQLTSLTGEAISIDESFKLCGQCHSTQLKEWEGGAHGKQLNGWAPPRVATTCVGCHNPHQPAFQPRLPARLNTNSLEDQ